MAVKKVRHQRRRKKASDSGDTENSNPSRSSEEKSALDETQDKGDSSRVLLVIVALALVFIAIMTYFVAQMPQKP